MKPKVIAYSKGLTIIPFENVIACTEDPGRSGQLAVLVNSPVADVSCTMIAPEDANEFIELYNIYLAAVEGLQLSATWKGEEAS
jgi:hypothetical protein